MEPDADSGDVIGEIPGREHPEEVVVIGGHIDSWDVGQGAQDDGAAIMASLQALALIKKLGLQPRAHPARGVLGERGERQPRRRSLPRLGGGPDQQPRGGHRNGWRRGDAARLRRRRGRGSMDMLRQIGKLLEPIGAGEITGGGGGEDIAPADARWRSRPGRTHRGTHYFDWHHTEADTLDKVDPDDFRKNMAAWP